MGDQLATSTCSIAKFGVVDAQIYPAGAGVLRPAIRRTPTSTSPWARSTSTACRSSPTRASDRRRLPAAHDRRPAARSGCVLTRGRDPRHHAVPRPAAISTCPQRRAGRHPVRAHIPTDLSAVGAVAGFPIDGDDRHQARQGRRRHPDLAHPAQVLGGVTGRRDLARRQSSGPAIDVARLHRRRPQPGRARAQGPVRAVPSRRRRWEGRGELQVPAGGSAFDLKLDVAFANGEWTKGSIDFSLPYPGFPLNDAPPPPALYFTHGGLDLDFQGGNHPDRHRRLWRHPPAGVRRLGQPARLPGQSRRVPEGGVQESGDHHPDRDHVPDQPGDRPGDADLDVARLDLLHRSRRNHAGADRGRR